MAKRRNCALDYLKGIACFGVVFFHIKMPSYYLDGVIQAMFRYVIPLFFMVAGYYCRIYSEKEVKPQIWPKIKHIFCINAIGCTYYFVFQLLIGLFGDSHGSYQDMVGRIAIMFTPRTLLEWIVFNQDPFVNLMWFTSALLYCYVLMWLIAKWNWYKAFYVLIPVFILIHLVLGNVLFVFGIDTDLILYRNFLLFGMPFFMLGHLIYTNEGWILQKVSVKKSYALIIVGAVVSIVEWFVFTRQELFVGSIMMVLGMFCMALHNPIVGEASVWRVIGQKYSLFIYITHTSVGIVMDRFIGGPLINYTKLFCLYSWLKVFLVFASCLIAGIVFYRIVDTAKVRGRE